MAKESTGEKATRWFAKIVAVGIFTVVGWLPKLVMPADSAPLVEKLEGFGGRLAVTGIGVVELVTVALILVPKTALLGAGLAVVTMLGAIGSHLGPVGIEGDFLGVFVMALVGLAASVVTGAMELRARRARGGTASV